MSKSKGDPKKGQGSCAPRNVVIVIRGNESEATAKAIEVLLRLGCTFYTKVKIIYNICWGSLNKQRIKNTTYGCYNEYRQGKPGQVRDQLFYKRTSQLAVLKRMTRTID